jgi:glycosyltransferase involved in cell wall biosynthesis
LKTNPDCAKVSIDICICTRNPRFDVLEKAIKSIYNQQGTEWHTLSILVVDNASNPPITESIFGNVNVSTIATRLIREPLPGTARARVAAAKLTSSEWILFVDDDNELSPDYVSTGISIINNHPTLGCFSGKLLLPHTIYSPVWTKPFLLFLGIKDCGEERIERLSEEWGLWEPPTAGAFVHRDVLQEYLRRSSESEDFFLLGERPGKLLRCEDSIIMRSAYLTGRSNAYEPSLVLWHHLNPDRFRFFYIMRLMYGFGISNVIVDIICKGLQPIPGYYKSKSRFLRLILSIMRVECKKSVPLAIGWVAYHLGARREHFSRQV